MGIRIHLYWRSIGTDNPTSVTLNDHEQRYFTEFDSFAGRLRHSG